MSDAAFSYPISCECCGRELNRGRAVMLDRSFKTNLWSAEGWPEEESQGGFWFGKACAKKVLAKQARAA